MLSPKIILKAQSIYPKKQLGQNFICNAPLCEKIVNISKIEPEDVVLEIGPGLGALTVPIAAKAKKIYAVEKDSDIMALLKTELFVKKISNVVLLNQDILKFDFNQPAEEAAEKKIIAAGALPYNISSQIIVRFIEFRSFIKKAVIIIQKEMADRLTAKRGTKEYGRLTVMLDYCSDIKKLFDIKAELFFPKPAVDSTVLEIEFKEKYKTADQKLLFKTIKAGFSKRRKTLRNSLAGNLLNLDVKQSLSLLKKAGIEQTRRAETLSAEEFIRLAGCI